MNKEEIKQSIYAEEVAVLYLIRILSKEDNEQSIKIIRICLDGLKDEYRKDSNSKRFLNTLLSYSTILENAKRDMEHYNNTNFILPILIQSKYDHYRSKAVLYASFSKADMIMEDGMIKKLCIEIDLYSNIDEHRYHQMCKLTKAPIRIIIEPLEFLIGKEDKTTIQIVENDRVRSYIENVRKRLGSRDNTNIVFTALDNHMDALDYLIKDTDEYLDTIAYTITNLAIAYANIVAYDGIEDKQYIPLCLELMDEDIER